MAVDQQEIIRRAERIAAIRPSPAATQRAVAEALAAVASQPRPASRDRQWLLPVAGVLAACLAIGIGLSLFTKLNRPTPESRINNVLARWEHYNGWMELTPAAPVVTRLAAADPAAKAPTTVSVRTVYVNPAEGAEAYVGEIGTAKYVAMQRGEHREVYDGRSDTLVIRDNVKAPLLASNAGGPGRLPQLLTKAREVAALDPVSLRYTKEGSEDRFHVTLPEPAPASTGLPLHGPLPEGQIADASLERPGLTLWTDARSGMLSRISAVQGGSRWTATVTYGRSIASVYDLGAPRTAKPASK